MKYGIRYMENISINIFVSKDKVFKYEDKTTPTNTNILSPHKASNFA